MAPGRYINKTESSPEIIVNTLHITSAPSSLTTVGLLCFMHKGKASVQKSRNSMTKRWMAVKLCPFFLYSHLFGGLCVRRQVMK